MSTGHSVIPFNGKYLAKYGAAQYLEEQLVFAPQALPKGRFPTLKELRESIQELGYQLEETQDWYVTSEDDFTEIWFKDGERYEDSPSEFWFRRGGFIVLDIGQTIANRCGSIISVNHSGAPVVLLVPDNAFSYLSAKGASPKFLPTIERRLTDMIEKLKEASLDEILFILSQIRQALGWADHIREYEFFRVVQVGVPEYKRFLTHDDARVRFLAFDLIASFQERFYEQAEALKLAIKNESNSHFKKEMIYAVENRMVSGWIDGKLDPPRKGIFDLLLELSEKDDESPAVRLAATHLLANVQPGLLTSAMRGIIINALVYPKKYEPESQFTYHAIDLTLKSIEKMLLVHRIEILSTALPQMTVAQDAHEVLRALLDHIFFGRVHQTWMSSLTNEHAAERPQVDKTYFRENSSDNWLYPANPTKLTAAEILPFQRKILETVIALDIPWMVHSNLLEKYGLPVTRALLREFLTSNPDR